MVMEPCGRSSNQARWYEANRISNSSLTLSAIEVHDTADPYKLILEYHSEGAMKCAEKSMRGTISRLTIEGEKPASSAGGYRSRRGAPLGRQRRNAKP
jgi:hypothetical protein